MEKIIEVAGNHPEFALISIGALCLAGFTLFKLKTKKKVSTTRQESSAASPEQVQYAQGDIKNVVVNGNKNDIKIG